MIRRFHPRLIEMAVAAMLCCCSRAMGQVQAGNDVVLTANGTISAGYSGSYAEEAPSSHGLLFGGIGDLNGSYYSPQFLSFNISPFYNQSRNSASFSAINDSSGVIARANIFGGSHFPGYVSFSQTFNSESEYQIPGVTNLKTNGNNQTLGVGWSVNLKNLPTISLGYQQATTDSTLYGAQSDSLTHFHSLFGNANYTLDGFHLSGGVHYSNGNSQFPELVAGQPIQNASSDTTTYNFNVTRSVFWEGNTWANVTRNDTNYDSQGLSSSQSADIVSAGVALKPTSKLSAQFTTDYDDSLAGTIYQQLNSAGVITPVSIPAGSSHSFGVSGQAQYSVLPGLYVAGGISHRQQLFLGTNYDSTAYNGSVSYGHRVLDGQFTASGTVTYNTLAATDQSMLGFLSTATYIRHIGGWNVSGSFNYSQNVQTILVAYTSSGYGYSSSVSRRFGRLNWNGSAAGSKSLLTQVAGTTNFAQTYSTGLSGRWLGASAGYSKSSGTGLFTATGITTLPPGVPPQFLPTTVFFAGTTYSVGLGSTPIRGLTFNGNWLRSVNTTENGLLPSNNKTEQTNAYLIYRVRQVYFNAGYSRMLQGFSLSGLPASNVSSYYFGISRWFRFF